jgi:hypothetical protein
MAVEHNFFNRMSKSNKDSTGSMGFSLNLDLLTGCAHKCSGCYVNKGRHDENWQRTISRALKVAEGLASKGLKFAEVVLSPTDFFSAANTKEILLYPPFQELFKFHPTTRITTACIFENVNKQRFTELFEILDDASNYRKDMILEFLAPLNTKKMLDRDDQYFADNHWAIDFFQTQSTKVIDWSFVANISNNELLKHNFGAISQTIREEFNTILEFNPGFFRSNNPRIVNRNLDYWKSMMEDVLTDNDYHEFNLVDINHNHSSANLIALHFFGEDVFVSPFIFEQVLDTHEMFRLESLEADYIMANHVDLQTKGFRYANETTDCGNCHMLAACAGRNVLNFMETRGLKECMLPKQYRDISHAELVAVR